MILPPPCPKCLSEFTYADDTLYICPDCTHEWSQTASEDLLEQAPIVKDAHGVELKNGDTITVLRDLKVKGSSLVIKVGTKVKNIRLIEGDHDIDCKVDGVGSMQLKSQFVRKI